MAKRSKKEYQELQIKQALDVDVIETGYFEREREENLKEQGFEVKVKEITYSDIERIIRKGYRDMEELEGKRTERVRDPYDGGDPDDIYGELITKIIVL